MDISSSTSLGMNPFHSLTNSDNVFLDPYAAGPASKRTTAFLLSPFSPLVSLERRFASWLQNFNLPAPGTMENWGRDAKSVLPTNLLFDGTKAEITKHFNVAPVFFVSHNFALGGQTQAGVNPGNYTFATVYGSDSALMQASVDGDGSVTGRANIALNPEHTIVARAQTQIPGSGLGMAQSAFVYELDYTKHNISLSAKAYSPSMADGTGNFQFGALASVTHKIALGLESTVTRQFTERGLMTSISEPTLFAKYSDSTINGKSQPYTATANYYPGSGILNMAYHQKLGERVEAAAEFVQFPEHVKQKPIATIGAKFDFRLTGLRAAVDSQGKVMAYLEQRLNPLMVFLVSGEIDHMKNTSRWGFGVNIEMAPPPSEMEGIVGVSPPV